MEIRLNYSQFCSSGWPEIHYEAQIDLKLIAILHWPEYWYHQQESPCLAYAAVVYEVCHWAMSMWLALYKHTVGHILLQVLFGTSWWEHFAAAESREEPSEGPQFDSGDLKSGGLYCLWLSEDSFTWPQITKVVCICSSHSSWHFILNNPNTSVKFATSLFLKKNKSIHYKMESKFLRIFVFYF